MTGPDELVCAARYLGARPDLVQGGGGNVSVKVGAVMLVKASGVRLQAVDRHHGHVAVDHAALRARMARCDDERDYQRALAELSAGTGRASVETGFHALLGPVVIHSHSVYVNVVACARDGRALLLELFPDACFVPYAAPGWAVTRALRAAIGEGAPPAVVFLQNHGLIVAADTARQAIALHEHINRELMSRFAMTPWSGTDDAPPQEPAQRFLWPDQVVYAATPDSAAAAETRAAAAFVLAQQRRLGLEPRWLGADDVALLRGLESEAYRLRKVAS